MTTNVIFRFPFHSFRAAAAFREFIVKQRALLDARYAYETGRAAATAEPVLVAEGTCGLCLRATMFRTPMPEPAAGEEPPREPNWREGQLCACAEQLNCRLRGLLHFVTAEIEPAPWTRLLLLGAAQAIEPRLQRLAESVSVRARSGRLLRPPRFEPRAYHLAISCEQLHAEPAIEAVLAGLRDALMPGGRLVFTAPFDTAADQSVPARVDRPGVLGWDILQTLARAGFTGAAAHLYWSEEFGYLGAFNMIFSAVA